MNFAKFFAAFSFGILLCSCASVQLWHTNPASPHSNQCGPSHIYLDPSALSLQHSQEFLYHSDELDLVKDSLNSVLQKLGILPFPISDQELSPVSRAWTGQMWFRARWPLYRGLDSNSTSLLIHRLDLGTNLKPSLLYGANFSTSEEGETDTLSPSQRQYPRQIQAWTCITLWNNTQAQYQAYGCFPFEFKGPPAPWDSTLHQESYWRAWLQNLQSKVCP